MNLNPKAQRFTGFRTKLSERGTHTHFQSNADDEAQYEGVIFGDGTVVMRWLTECKATSVWSSLEDMLNVHGHPEYGTKIVFHDGPVPDVWQKMLDNFYGIIR